ncbi:MAG TPA: hypothetical protein VH592_23655 [Gemmataceae bacterium]
MYGSGSGYFKYIYSVILLSRFIAAAHKVHSQEPSIERFSTTEEEIWQILLNGFFADRLSLVCAEVSSAVTKRSFRATEVTGILGAGQLTSKQACWHSIKMAVFRIGTTSSQNPVGMLDGGYAEVCYRDE